MLDAPGGGGGGTPWEAMTIEDMQRLIQNPDTDKQWDWSTGWKKSAELLASTSSRCRTTGTTWLPRGPRTKSTASAAYLARLDALIANLTETYEAALANYDAISAATGSIYQAQSQDGQDLPGVREQQVTPGHYNAKQQPTGTTPTPSQARAASNPRWPLAARSNYAPRPRRC